MRSLVPLLFVMLCLASAMALVAAMFCDGDAVLVLVIALAAAPMLGKVTLERWVVFA